MKYLLGIDIGTSSVKVAALNENGQVMALTNQEYPILTPAPGWAEQDPEKWVSAVIGCIRQVFSTGKVEPSDVAGIGLAGQMHSLVCLGEDGKPLRPAILWADQRSSSQVEKLTSSISKEKLAESVGNPIAAGFMLASWLWLLENEIDTVNKTRWLMLPKDYVRFQMTGKIGTEPSDASSTLLFDPHRRRWAPEILNRVEITEDNLPRIFLSTEISGGLTDQFANYCGLLPGTPVVYGGSDVSLQALSQGVVEPGTVSCTIGTGGQLFAPQLAPTHDPQLRLHLFCHALPGLWHHEAAILSAGLALRWLRDGFWPGETYQSLANLASEVEAARDGLFFLPFLAGERTPYMNPLLHASFVGIGLRHQRAHFIRAAMEGVVFGLKQGIDLMHSLGNPVSKIISTGGGARHPLWLQLQADIFNRPIFVSHDEEATARGAAILAGIGIGIYKTAADAVQRVTRPAVIGAVPDSTRSEQYAGRFSEYIAFSQMLDGYYAHSNNVHVQG